ncbi:DNA-binding transcriptional regulator, LysR family [Cribrihabitans marinus]|uniref:DNA-binding transcriptional regulator, LysR family n=1 Tax=Cribrihabitans marinus TaxID=1227549 RepID=A0A1H6Y0I3_9RHOB|nr:LysR family transcriptional regulator [Cribrihabitans marinus]GGH28157.1 LysR family transcriptional regulator [Cribrihabitans marinus]SEJ33404.1 DNA-binding transcriptional regulator, LysR family [Cribrihabitans marinus]
MNLSGFDLNLLRVLDALLAEHSTVRAGQRVGLSQPAVSAALKRLRQSLGDDLFIRRGQRLEPTEFARSIAEPLRELLDDAETLLSGPRQFDPASARMRFRISGSDFFAEMLMPELGERIAAEAPGILLQLVDLVPDNYIDTLETYAVDLALIPKPDLPGWLDWQGLFSSYFSVIARRGHPELSRLAIAPGDTIPLEAYCALGHIVFSVEGNTTAMGDAALARVGRTRRVVMTLPSFYGVHSVVAGSDHVALVPRQLACRLQHRLGLDVFAPPMPIPTPSLGMIWHKRFTNAPAHRWLRGQIAALLEPLHEDRPAHLDAG